ncbi:MAG: UDP-2,4-diacetamido-2,4,6-trideoxy-beta-L-altropyranose hydrolase [Lentisphaerae bacterium GWF2_52_8]|nr:MAG: UDP-2,4-diacetamido-2,4,6-trideoxy-beta-L-altropyranose hydrolase [Lentisphaerae bacterium GWF2_52_8]
MSSQHTISGSKIAIRADASTPIGYGHLMRCLTLAGELREAGAKVFFLCRELPGNLNARICEQGFELTVLPDHCVSKAKQEFKNPYAAWLGCTVQEDAADCDAILSSKGGADILIVDNYALDAEWEMLMRQHARVIMVIDDLAAFKHDCDLLLDQNFYLRQNRYAGLVPSHCRVLTGPRHALLRREFAEAKKTLRKRNGELKKILLSFGGSDPDNETAKALVGLETLRDIELDVVIGAAHPDKDGIRKWVEQHPNARLHIQSNRMAELMAAADLGIGFGGSTNWERCFLGLPCLVVVPAENERQLNEDLATSGAIKLLGFIEKLRPEDYARAVASLTVGELVKISEAASGLVPGGGPQIVINELQQLLQR